MAITVNGAFNALTSRQYLASIGAYFSVTNPTLGTGVAYALKTGTSTTANGLVLIANNNAVGTPSNPGKSIYVDRLKLIQTATAATGNLSSRIEVISETGIVAMTTAVATITPVNVNPGFSNVTGAAVQMFSAGAGTVPSAVGTRRTIGWGSCTSGPSILWDSLTIEFGADGSAIGTAQLTAAKATAAADYVMPAPVMVVAPQTSAWVNFYVVTQAANTPSYEYLLNYAEI